MSNRIHGNSMISWLSRVTTGCSPWFLCVVGFDCKSRANQKKNNKKKVITTSSHVASKSKIISNWMSCGCSIPFCPQPNENKKTTLKTFPTGWRKILSRAFFFFFWFCFFAAFPPSPFPPPLFLSFCSVHQKGRKPLLCLSIARFCLSFFFFFN